MAPKRPSPLDDPPPSLSDDGESEDIGEEDDDDDDSDQGREVAEEGSEEEDTDDEDGQSEEEKGNTVIPSVEKKPSLKKPAVSESGSDSDSGSDQTQGSPTASDYAIKPIASKSIGDSKKSKKLPLLSPPPKTSNSTGKKRPAQTEANGADSRGKKKKTTLDGGVDEDGGLPAEEKKFGVHRLWSEDDEIAVLNGMLEYQRKKCANPYDDMAAFHEFVKKSLRCSVSKAQLSDKIRRLKKKYLINVERVKNGEDPIFSKPHENKTFELGKKIWGVESNKKGKRSGGKVANNNASPLTKKEVGSKSEAHKVEDKKGVQENTLPEKGIEQNVVLEKSVQVVKAEEANGDLDQFWSHYPRLKESMNLLPESFAGLAKEMMSSIGSTKAKEWDEKWRKLQEDEIELHLKRINLIREQTKLILAAINSSKP